MEYIQDPGVLAFTFLDVGQGDGTLIRFPNGKFALVDLGSKKNATSAGKDAIDSILLIMKESGASKIDYLFLTHGDGDHFNLLEPLVERRGTRLENVFLKVYFGGKSNDYSGGVARFLNTHEDVNKYCKHFSNPTGNYGDGYSSSSSPIFTEGGVEVYVLAVNVKDGKKIRSKNTGSLVLMFRYGDNKIILMGDAELATENFIMDEFKSNSKFLGATLLKLAHHGSRGSNSRKWLEIVQPVVVVASADQKWGHPDRDALDRVRSIGSLGKLAVPNHSYVQSSYAKGDYIWQTVKEQHAILTNLFRVTKEPGGGWFAEGTAYHIEFGADGRFGVSHTFIDKFSFFERSDKSAMSWISSECEYEDELDAD